MSSNKPFPSSDLDVFKDNSLILDNFVNSQENEYPDRFKRKRPTITGIIKEAFSVRSDISNMNETLIGQSRWDVVPKNTSLSLGGDNGALNKQAQALFNRTEMLKVHAREALRRTYQEVGLNLVEGSFEEGAVITSTTDVVLHEKTGECYSGPIGQVPKGTSPNQPSFQSKTLDVSISSTHRVENFRSLQSAIDFAKRNGIKVLRVDTPITSGDVTSKGAVSFVGNGSIKGVYRKRVAKDTDPTVASFNNIDAEINLPRFLSKRNPVVVIVGDSISTPIGANVPTSDTLYSRICNRLASAYPNKTITFHNRAIGGENYFSAVGLPSNFPTWYTDRTRSWLRYVGDLQPDLVIFNFGMNDTSNLHNNTLTEYLGYMSNLSVFPGGKPDLIYCTNLTPSIDTTFANLGSEFNQAGRDHVAGFTRTFAKSIGAGLLDFHRQCTIVKDGYDPTDTYLEKIGNVTPVGGSVSSPEKCTDFKWELTLTLDVGKNMAVRLGSPSDPAIDPLGRGSYVVIANQGGMFKCDFFYAILGNNASVYGSLPANGSVPSGSFVLTVEKKQNTFLMSVGGVEVARYDKLRVGGADVHAKAGDATYTSGTITSAVFYAGRYRTYKQSITNDDMWGVSDNQAIQRQPYGGNGANHPSSIGCSAIFQPVLDMAVFSTIIGDETEYISPINNWREVAGVTRSSCTRSGRRVTISFFAKVPVDNVAAKGVIFNVPEQYRPPAGKQVYGLAQNSNSSASSSLVTLQSNGNIELFTNVDQFIWGTITFSHP